VPLPFGWKTLWAPRRAATLVLLTTLAGSTDGKANGRFPAVDQLVVEPGNPDHLVLRGTFGVLVTRDRGGSWDFLCEAAMGYKDTDPALAVLPGGVILLGLQTGISRSDELGCTFEPALGITEPVPDVSAVRAEPGTAYAVSSAGYTSQFWESTDQGATFLPLGERLSDFSADTLDAAPTNANLIYASGLVDTTGVLLRSDNRAESFTTFEIPGSNPVHRPYIAAIDPTDENTVFVRLDGLPGKLLVTRDGGAEFREILQTDVPAQGFALSPDGSIVVASNPFDGTFVATRPGYEFQRVACGGPSCLLFEGDELYGCGDDFVDGYIVGLSRNVGESFERVIDLGCLTGPTACGAASGVGEVCPADWPMVMSQIGAGTCNPRDIAPDRSCFADGGEGAGGSVNPTAGAPAAGRAGAGGASGAGSGSAGTGAPVVTEGESACSCRITGRGRPMFGVQALLAAVLLFGARRATRRHA
jgi:hypothetical protein